MPKTFSVTKGGSAATVPAEIAITGPVTATLNRRHVISGTAAPYIIALPPGATDAWMEFRVKVWASATALYTLDGDGSEAINGAPTRIMWAEETARIEWDGTQWMKKWGVTRPMYIILSRVGTSQPIPNAVWTAAIMDTRIGGLSRMFDGINGRATILRPASVCVVAGAYLTATGFSLAYICPGLNQAANTLSFQGLPIVNDVAAGSVLGQFDVVVGDWLVCGAYTASSGGSNLFETAAPPVLVVTETAGMW